MSEAKGHCLCGAVKFSVKAINTSVDACHCGMCRRWGGGPLMCVDCGKDLIFEGEDHITVYDSSDWAERGFCRHCGSHLFYRLKESHGHQVPVGLFEDQAKFHFELQIFIDHKPDFYRFENQTRVMTEAEVIALFAPQQKPEPNA